MGQIPCSTERISSFTIHSLVTDDRETTYVAIAELKRVIYLSVVWMTSCSVLFLSSITDYACTASCVVSLCPLGICVHYNYYQTTPCPHKRCHKRVLSGVINYLLRHTAAQIKTYMSNYFTFLLTYWFNCNGRLKRNEWLVLISNAVKILFWIFWVAGRIAYRVYLRGRYLVVVVL